MASHVAPQEHAAHAPTVGPPADVRRASPRLTLAPARGQVLNGILGELAKLYLLDVNGVSLLTRRAAMEIKLIAVMLTINFLFDFAVWTLLWNMVFYAGKLRVGLLTFPAVFCGFLFSAIIFVYERQFMTADTYRRFWRVWWPVTIRLLVIAVAAAITTQPFEVMVFSGPIQRRIHEESVRVEALSRLRAFEEAQLKTTAEGLRETVVGQELEGARAKGEEARRQANRFRAEAQAARSALERAEGAVRSAAAQRARARTRAQAAAASRRLAAAQSRAEQARADLNDAEAQVKTSAEDERHWEQRVGNVRKEVEQKGELAEKDVKRLRDWIAQIRNASAGQFVEEDTDQSPKWKFRDHDYDFFQRLGVINDLYYGRPPRWLEATSEDRQKLSGTYGLSDADEDDALANERRLADASTFKWSYWAVIGIAAVIPLLLLALKGLLPVDLKLYYSMRAQQEAGNYEALRFHFADGLRASHDAGDGHNGHRAQAHARSALD